MSVTTRLRDVVDDPGNEIYLKYLLPTLVGSIVTLVGLGWVFGVGNTGYHDKTLPIFLLVGMVSTAIPASLIHKNAPETPVDRYQKLGILFTMFISANVVVTTTAFLAVYTYPYMGDFAASGTKTFVADLLIYTVISSLLLPGPYAGTLVGRHWSK
jgi:hypothetical protein